MKALLTSGLSLALFWAAAAAQAQETQWRSAALPPVQPAGGIVSGAVGALRPVSLARPVPLTASATSGGLVRGQAAEEKPLQPLPDGPTVELLHEGKSTLTSRPSVFNGASVPNVLSTQTPSPIPPGTPKAGPGAAPAPAPSTGAPFTGPAPQLLNPQPGVPYGPGTGGILDGSIWGNTVMPGVPGPVTGIPGGITGDGACGDACGGTCCPCGPCGSCSDLCCDSCNTCSCFPTCCGSGCDRCCGGKFWVSAEYLLWWTRGQPTPPLVTASPVGTPTGAIGVIGQPTTAVLFDRFNNDPRSGGRFSGGIWFPRACDWGLDFSFFFLGTTAQNSTFGGPSNVLVARPLTDAVTGAPISEFVNVPGIVTGTVSVYNTQTLWGAEGNLRHRFLCGCNYWVDGLLGYRYLYLSEETDITENLTVANPDGTPAGITVNDRFRTTNHFNGGQLGLAGQWYFAPRWFLGGSAKVALGDVHQTVDIAGNTTFTGFDFPGAINGTRNGGILALPTNIGHHSSNRFAVLPEFNLKVGYDITQNLSVFVGYDFLYLSSVVRPGAQIDPTINRSQIPNVLVAGTPALVGPARPAVPFKVDDFWAQGVTFGLRYRW